jgi:hypothetical protein
MMAFFRMLPAVFALFILLASTAAVAKTYWHFTFTISKASDQSEREWVWVTMVEVPRSRAYPEEAETVRRMGGQFEGTWFALVRGAAWRAAYSETSTVRCSSGALMGSLGTEEIYWHESESDSVYAHGGVPTDGNDFSIIINTRPILRENGTWDDPESHPHAFSLPIIRPGEPEVKIKGRYHVQGINYNDPNQYKRTSCPGKEDKILAKQFRSKLIQFGGSDNLRDSLIGNSAFGQKDISTRGDSYHLVWGAIRSNSSRHPHWKRQEM